VATVTEVEIDVFAEDRVIPARSLNLSLGGALVRAREGVNDGETVLVVVSAGERFVVSLGEVLGSTVVLDTGVIELRLRFVNLSGASRDNLAHFLESL
jgi:hypothetical protein